MDYRVIANLFLLLFIGVADNQIIAALLPSLVHSFGITVGTAGLLITTYSLAAAVAAFFSGSLSDHYGRRRFLLAGILVFCLATWLTSRSATLAQILSARALTGLAAGTISTCAIAFAGDWFAYSVRGRAVGLISTAYFAAPVIGVPVAAQVADRFGWRIAFLVVAVSALLVGGISFLLPEDSHNPEPSRDKLRATGRAFRSILRRHDAVAALVIAFLVSGGLVGFIAFIGQWLNSHFGIPTRTIGWVFMLSGLVAMASAPMGGTLSDKLGKRPVLIASNVLLACAFVAVPFLDWGVWLLFAFSLTSLAAAFRQGPLTALMTELVPPAQRGSFIALRNISSQLGIAAAATVGGLLYQWRGYAAVAAMCAAMTVLVALLLTTHIVEPQSSPAEV
ncbi:MAG: MFS transporter [Acidobacteria bacterium]|nr:MFS transporter [Acidobacteriota bacterium]